MPDAQFVFARAPHLDDRLFESANALPGAAVVLGDTDTVLAAADLALTASGTATVQSALHGTPMVVVYRLSPLTYRIGRPLVKIDTFAMVNLIAGRRIVPELIQDAFTADAVAAHATALLTDTARAEEMRAGLAEVRRRLGGSGASGRAADAILNVVRETCAAS
jgi:lipid-A-disaccharide synthase